ncbi:Tim44 domain-containing protein [Kaistia dalseonensis]|uniref:Lipid-binding transport protein (Tim44 family) n=1 Tax=Kaistia dalseonensis TaxID=410840 RepID=A0ABU0H0E9_9HYPH|nr:Tim44 domain-containing protein [Kaistia dalseonensis]MCX5493230.1 Tim44 domain-containing protein [Kaistia dalseonensis]MDQ0435785.1 putative lipid-binding transport protein (Tim44 family) [Kaistia dalseonensis]
MGFLKRSTMVVAALALVMSMAAVGDAEARRGGSFGSRGVRTYQAPPVTATAPKAAAPVQRSVTPQSQQTNAAAAGAAQAARPGFFGGFGGSMLRGLMIGGLIGMLLGHGFGGFAGALGMIVQIALLALGAMLLMRFLANRRQPSPAGGPSFLDSFAGAGLGANPLGVGAGVGAAAPRAAPAPSKGGDEIGLNPADFDRFEQLLAEIQGAFGREDYAALRERTTPEIMSFLAEELSQNATNGLRNEVSDVKLLQGDLAEAWREGDADYATVAMRYESRDLMREREGGRVVAGNADAVTETTEIWTFVRRSGGDWKLSAIQET